MDALVQRLVQNPHDHDALTYAHAAGQTDPRSYAMLLEKVGTATSDAAFASHWLTESAKVWADTLNDLHRAARALMIAIDRDPTQPAPAERLAELYRDKGDTKALVALLERRAKALSPLAQQDPEMRAHVAGLHEELGRLWADAPLEQPRKAIENFRRALDYDPTSQYAIYSTRELLKSQSLWSDAIPYFALELGLVDDPERQVALYRDEADVRRQAGDLAGAAAALRHASSIDQGRDPSLAQELGTALYDRVQRGEALHAQEAQEGAQIFVSLAEQYPGEHAFSYSLCALELEPANDRAIQLAIYYGEQLARMGEVAPKAAAYLTASPHGAIAEDARRVAGSAPAQQPAPRPEHAAVRSHDPEPDSERFDDDSPPPAPVQAANPERVRSLLDAADALVRKTKKHEAAEKYREVVELDPINPDAIGFLEGYLRQTRKYAELRDLLLAAAKTPGVDAEARRGWLREIAGLCETQLRDLDGAIYAWKQLASSDRSEDGPKTQLRRLLEKAQRWDDLCTVLEQDAEQETDIEARISMEKQLAKLHEQKRKDPVAAGEAWGRIANLAPGDESALATAVKLFERGERPDLAAAAIADNVTEVEDDASRAQLFKKLGGLREAAGDLVSAGEAFSEAATLGQDASLWEAAERCFVAAQVWDLAANAVQQRVQLTSRPKEQAVLLATEAEYLSKGGDESSAVLRLEQATDLDPTEERHASTLEERYVAADRTADLVAFLLRRAEKITDREQRVALRKRAATTQRELLADPEAARETLAQLLRDGDDAEALELLAEDAEVRSEFGDAVEYLHRLAKLPDLAPERRLEILMREARLVAEGLDDSVGAVERYENILERVDSKNVDALDAIAALHERAGDAKGQADALERRLALTETPDDRRSIAETLATLYEGPLDDPRSAVRALDVLRALDPEDFDAIQRACDLAERLEDWPRVAEHTAQLVEVEGDDAELSRMTRRLAEVLSVHLERSDEALAALMVVADQGDDACRQEYVKLADQLGWKGIVATKLVEWHLESPVGPARHEALRGAFERFVEVGRQSEAAQVAQELVRTRGADPSIAKQLEEIAASLQNLEALAVAHDLLAQDLTGPSRADEMVRQAEVLVAAGVDAQEALQHGEQALTSVPADEVEPLLQRLSNLAPTPAQRIDLYERQIVRCKAPSDRLTALARAAAVAAEHDALDRARGFFDLALGAGGGTQEDTLEVLETAARNADAMSDEPKLLRVLAQAMSAGGQGSRDGGRTRSSLLRRAAELAFRDLADLEQAFVWLGDALVTHVDEASLSALETLATEVGDMRRAETVLTRALEEVFDGPLVRQLLARRATLRRERLADREGAAADLKRLHDLSPADMAVTDELAKLYTELEDWRGMVQLYEDQILRGKDPGSRAELARKVARLWEERLDDPREAADAWRRVLRMKSNDPEGTAGLERAKAAMIGKAREPKKSDAPPARPAVAPEPKAEPAASAAASDYEAAADVDYAGGDTAAGDYAAADARVGEEFSAHEPVAAAQGAQPLGYDGYVSEIAHERPLPPEDDEGEGGHREEEDGPTLPPPAGDPRAEQMAEAALEGLKPQRPDITFPTSDDVTVSASITELSTDGHPLPPTRPSSGPPPPPSRGAPLPHFQDFADTIGDDPGAVARPDELDSTAVQPSLQASLDLFEDTTNHDRENSEEDELVVDDDELFEEEP